MKLWSGGIQRDQNADSTVAFVKRDIEAEIYLMKYEILSLIAYHLDLAQRRLITEAESKCIINSLISLLQDSPKIDPEQEDAHTAVENAVIERCGDMGRNVRLFLSRNEQVHANVLMFTIERCHSIISILLDSIKVLKGADLKGLLPGTTHFMPAMPVTAATYSNYIENSLALAIRSIDRSLADASVLPYGYGSGYGSPNSGKLKVMSEMLGIGPVLKNPMIASSLYQFTIMQISNSIAGLSITLSRIAMDLIEYYRDGYVSLSDEFTTGSSLMPNKRNPDYLELLQGMAAVSSSVAVMSAMATMNKTSGYHRDFQMLKDSYIDMLNYIEEALLRLPDLFKGLRFEITDPMMLPGSIFATGNAWEDFANTHDWKQSYANIGRKIREKQDLKRYMPEDYVDIVEMHYLEEIEKKYGEILKKWDYLIEKAEAYISE
ncbi:argininosuccinate lyase related protein [Thermoplasma acidophilum]|uniref:Argininosuccinate lyase related protein n=1 Tax=Thermoplasma acidophilum (strain ATCC 25905 / DSM 1728 / JCM 9062 / NBRC 15155 / AMRC-C165) TaxID=273075 RepID=Q9HKF2_THEAC|nr:lyase family protein [Thermoplasma acidophilum]CAC11787.1 argininosuccinate lyase related protein [Thermoplasma acidophilum]